MSAFELLLDLLLVPAIVVGTLLGLAAALALEWFGPADTDLTVAQAFCVALGFVAGAGYSFLTRKKTE